jgi:signal transduction histidine kinase
VFAVTLGVAGVVFVAVLQQQLISTLTGVARAQSADVADQLASGESALPLVQGAGEQTVMQVVSSSGTVIAASEGISGQPPLVPDVPAKDGEAVVRTSELGFDRGTPYVVVVHSVSTPSGNVRVIAAQSLATPVETVHTVAWLFVASFPVLLALVAGMTSWATGRSLAPVAAIRARVDAIATTQDLAERVPVPGTRDEVGQLADTMNQMLARLQATVAARRQFVADASHELRTPLASIRASHEVAHLHPDSIGPAALHEDVMAELDRLDRLVSDMLLLARSDEAQLALAVAEIDVAGLVAREAERLRRSHGLDVVVDAEPARATADPHLLARALTNLAENAAAHAASVVELAVTADDQQVVIRVHDDGPGIPADDRERIFDRFVRLDESRARRQGGTGLGLAITRQIVRAHRGEVVVTDDAPGATFLVTIPCGSSHL